MFILVRRRQSSREYGSPSSRAEADAGVSGQPGLLASPGRARETGTGIRLGLRIVGLLACATGDGSRWLAVVRDVASHPGARERDRAALVGDAAGSRGGVVQVVTGCGPLRRDRAKNLLWAAGKLAGYGIGIGLEPAPAVLLHPSVIERFTVHAPGLSGPPHAAHQPAVHRAAGGAGAGPGGRAAAP